MDSSLKEYFFLEPSFQIFSQQHHPMPHPQMIASTKHFVQDGTLFSSFFSLPFYVRYPIFLHQVTPPSTAPFLRIVQMLERKDLLSSIYVLQERGPLASIKDSFLGR
ncbi:hypothetical protein TNCV_2145881 [Trichonephila clavipes]|uniref:Uncharacterized protein n=1 Tax=Trichonephila clavipes TaxID=2585209 RepID=A0A8X6VSJ7_TRICX|nr:hypothetical protein TNCV_2145881 [Trichonephila clavipes]